MFKIDLEKQLDRKNSRTPKSVVGTITLGSFEETFEAPIRHWRPSQYRSHWQSAARHLLKHGSAGFFTAVYDPKRANFIEWWPAWKHGDIVLFQNQLIVLEELNSPISLESPWEHVGKFSEDGEDGPVSTWQVSTHDVEKFVAN